MLIQIFFLDDVEIWNILLMLVYYLFIFYSLGRILQKRLNFNNSHILISIPIGFILFLGISFIFELPFALFDVADSFASTLLLIKELLIFAIIFIYFSDWKPTFNSSGFYLSIHDYVLFISVFIFIVYVILMNVFLISFNELSGIKEKATFDSIFTTLTLNQYNIQFLTTNNFISQDWYYEWFIYLLYSIFIFSISTLFTRNKTTNLSLNTILGFVTSMIVINIFFLVASDQQLLFEFIILFLAMSILFDYYGRWTKDDYNIILVFLVLFILYTVSYNGIFYFLIFFIGIILYQSVLKKNYINIFIYGLYIFFFEMVFFLIVEDLIIAIVFSFIILIFLFPLTINNLLKNSLNEHSDMYKEMVNQENTIEMKKNLNHPRGGKVYSLIIFILIFVSSLFLISISENSYRDFYLEYYSLSFLPKQNTTHTFAIIFSLFELPIILIYVLDLLIIKEDDEYTIFSNIYLIFLNPISMGVIRIFFDVNFEAFLLLWLLLITNYLIFYLPLKVYRLFHIVNDKILLKYERKYKRRNNKINTRVN